MGTVWNKGLTKETDPRIRGHPAWCKGLTRETDERVARQAKALSNKWANPTEAQLVGLEKTRQAHIGMKRTIKTRELISEKKRKSWANASPETRTQWIYNLMQPLLKYLETPEGRRHQSIAGKAPKPIDFGQKQSRIRKKQWKDPEWVAKTMAGINRKPTIPENKLIEICNKYFPEFRYNGDFSQGVTLNGLIPDFINCNGRKQVIEVFGDYWHSPEVIGDNWQSGELGKIMAYNSLGFHCLVIWEHELNELPEEQIVKKIRKFTKARR